MYMIYCRCLEATLYDETVIILLDIRILHIHDPVLAEVILDILVVHLNVSALCSNLQIVLGREIILNHMVYFNVLGFYRIKSVIVISVKLLLSLPQLYQRLTVYVVSFAHTVCIGICISTVLSYALAGVESIPLCIFSVHDHVLLLLIKKRNNRFIC